MFAVDKRLRQSKVSLDGHDERHTAGAQSKETAHDAAEAEEPNVVLVEADGHNGRNRSVCHHPHEANKVQRH